VNTGTNTQIQVDPTKRRNPKGKREHSPKSSENTVKFRSPEFR